MTLWEAQYPVLQPMTCMPGGNRDTRETSFTMKEDSQEEQSRAGKISAGISHEWQKLIQWHDEEIMSVVTLRRNKPADVLFGCHMLHTIKKVKSMFSLNYIVQEPEILLQNLI